MDIKAEDEPGRCCTVPRSRQVRCVYCDIVLAKDVYHRARIDDTNTKLTRPKTQRVQITIRSYIEQLAIVESDSEGFEDLGGVTLYNALKRARHLERWILGCEVESLYESSWFVHYTLPPYSVLLVHFSFSFEAVHYQQVADQYSSSSNTTISSIVSAPLLISEHPI